jgi:16S rRNA (cytosine967-C5)-methyltransferase
VGSVGPQVAEVLIEALGPETALAFARASLEPAPHVLRTNLLRAAPAEIADETGGAPGQLAYAVRLPEGRRALPADLPAVRAGRASPQDEASMRVVELLEPAPGDRVLDVCAAPGGKTCHAAERMRDTGEVVAHDRLPDRLARVRTNADRLGLGAVRVEEVLPPEDAAFDRVLVDAPCSGLGTLRRHPEIRWRFERADLDALAGTQAKVLAAGARRVRPGGVLVYAVCTVTDAEGPGALRALDGFELEAELRTGPHEPGAPDGFYAARLRRRPQ